MELEVGYGLVPLVDPSRGGDLLRRIQSIRRQFATSLGLIVPPIHIRDNLQLDGSTYRLLIKGIEVARGSVMADRSLAMNPGDVQERIAGIDTIEPAFGLPAQWIAGDTKEHAEALGYTVVDASTVIATHLTELIRANAHELIGRQEAQELINVFAESNPKVVEELIPTLLSLGDVLSVIRQLLRERVSIRDLRTILETLADCAKATKNLTLLTELVRQRLAKQITGSLRAPDGDLYVLTLAPDLEEGIRTSLVQDGEQVVIGMNPTRVTTLMEALESTMRELAMSDFQAALLVAPDIRRPLRDLVERFVPQLAVISHREVEAGVRVKGVKTMEA